MSLGRNKANFRAWLKNNFHGMFTLQSKYTGINNNVRIKHHSKHCGFGTFSVTAKQFKRNPKCPVCNGPKNNKFTIQQKINKLNMPFKVIKYVNKAHIKFQCPKGHTFNKSYWNFLKFPKCPVCIQLKRKKSFDKFLYKYGYKRIGKYKGRKNKTLIIHLRCKYTWKVMPSNFIYELKRTQNNISCPYCNHNIHWSTKIFKTKLYQEVKNNYSLIGPFVSIHKHVTLKHNICGYTFKVYPCDFLYNQHTRCPICASSKGEKITKMFLRNYNLRDFIHGYHLHNKIKPPFIKGQLHLDFYNPYLHIGIEFDGYQHFHPVNIFGGYAQFKLQKYHDSYKNYWCKNHNIKLIRIRNNKNLSTIKEMKKLVSNTLLKKLLPIIS